MKDVKTLFFNTQVIHHLNWKNQLSLRVGSILPSSRQQISRGLKNLSSESIRNRFMGSKKEFSESELEYLTKLDGWNHYAIGIEEDLPLSKGIAVGRLVRSGENPLEAEVAITVIDEFQGLGLGTFLIQLLTLAAWERNIERLTFTTLPQNFAIIHLIHKIGKPETITASRDFVQLLVDLTKVDLSEIKSQLERTLPSIETFHLET